MFGWDHHKPRSFSSPRCLTTNTSHFYRIRLKVLAADSFRAPTRRREKISTTRWAFTTAANTEQPGERKSATSFDPFSKERSQKSQSLRSPRAPALQPDKIEKISLRAGLSVRCGVWSFNAAPVLNLGIEIGPTQALNNHRKNSVFERDTYDIDFP